MVMVEYPESMARFKCNEQGCCCQSWVIVMQPPDLRRLIEHFSDAEMKAILTGAQFRNNSQGRLTGFTLRKEGERKACQFLATDSRCGLQTEHGAEVLPTICRAYPAGALQVGETRQLMWDETCPEVLERLDESDAPLEIVQREVEEGDHLEVRSRFRFELPKLSLGERPLTWEQVEVIRRRLVEAFNGREVSPMRLLGAANWALWRVSKGTPIEAFTVRPDDPMEPFEAHFERCYQAHDAALLVEQVRLYRRFVFALELGVDWDELEAHLGPRTDWRAVVDPEDPRLTPLLSRYLAHRAYTPFSLSFPTSQVDLVFATFTHHLATALRIAVGLVQWLGLEDVRTALKVGMGASELAYRSFRRAPTSAMPWFDPEA